MTTLEAHLAAGRGRDSVAVAVLVQAMAAAGVRIADELARAALIGQLGTTGDTDVQGEEVKKLDLWANDVIVEALDATGRACTLVSAAPHERVPLLIGSLEDVRLAEEFYAARRA